MVLNAESLRQEIKYKIFYADLPIFYHWLLTLSDLKQEYAARRVNSLYIDTIDYDFARANMAGLSRRIKVRGRWYDDRTEVESLTGSDRQDLNVVCEIKRKVNSNGDKIIAGRSCLTKDKDSQRHIYSQIEDFCITSSLKNGLKLTKRLKMSAFISYQREYYRSDSIRPLRLTIDKDIRYSSPTSPGCPILLSKGYVIVELKFPPATRAIVAQYMTEFPFRPMRSSKYVQAITQIKKVSY
jgi:hypothetical protein